MQATKSLVSGVSRRLIWSIEGLLGGAFRNALLELFDGVAAVYSYVHISMFVWGEEIVVGFD